MVFNMARLSEEGCFNDPETANKMQEEVLAQLEYSENFKHILRHTLTTDENARPDFIQLRNILKRMNIQPVSLRSVSSNVEEQK